MLRPTRTPERRQKGDDGDEQRSAGTDAHHPTVSRVEGASSAAAPMRGRDCSALADSLGTRPPAIPIASAAVTAANRKGRGKSCAPKLGLEIRSEEQTSELQSLMRCSYAVFCSKK